MRGVAQHGASVVPAGPNLTAPFNHAQMRCELNCAAALANTALEFSLTLGVTSGLFIKQTRIRPHLARPFGLALSAHSAAHSSAPCVPPRCNRSLQLLTGCSRFYKDEQTGQNGGGLHEHVRGDPIC
jgi:hypothetical protein